MLDHFYLWLLAICIASAVQAYSPWTLALQLERIEIMYCKFHNHRIVKELRRFSRPLFWRTRKASEDVIGILAGGQPIGQTF
ncbi:MAG: hypothetical protein DWI22_04240 [Planctomycetota bacterium]|nr:MAG: hypothetical protein DWI22_04240 [Planctomycetota bacterium]